MYHVAYLNVIRTKAMPSFHSYSRIYIFHTLILSRRYLHQHKKILHPCISIGRRNLSFSHLIVSHTMQNAHIQTPSCLLSLITLKLRHKLLDYHHSPMLLSGPFIKFRTLNFHHHQLSIDKKALLLYLNH